LPVDDTQLFFHFLQESSAGNEYSLLTAEVWCFAILLHFGPCPKEFRHVLQ